MPEYILAIDTSCDDTSAAVVSGQKVLSNVIASQTELHKPYGGVFPTVAKLAHKENIAPTIQLALKRAGLDWSQISAIAITYGPGLAPALEVGLASVKSLAVEHSLPVVPVNHIEGHILSVLAQPKSKAAKSTTPKTTVSELQLPALAVVVSGGHTQFVLVKKLGEYRILGKTLDDAAGECLDKIGRILNLGYPAGPIMEEFATHGNHTAYEFPLPLTTVKTFDVSFSGMKTFARNLLDKLTQEKPLTRQQVYDFCASAQYAVFRHICYKLEKVLAEHSVQEVWLGGGVAANMQLRSIIRASISKHTKNLTAGMDQQGMTNAAGTQSLEKIVFRVPYTKKLCADNAAMIGLVASLTSSPRLSSVAIEALERKPQLSL